VTGRLGILGGTFDPVHVGHLDAARAAQSALALDEVVFIPARESPLRAGETQASPFHRFAMVALAIDDVPSYRVSEIELVRPGRSYTIDTLHALHTEGWQPSQLFFIIGADAFADIAAWHAYPAILDAANFAVIARPGATLESAIGRVPELQSRVGQSIFLVNALTRDVSSTSIRQRLASGHGTDGLIPTTVARHIAAHHLYQAENRLHGHNNEESGS
jgi:nicotinate-nucleotide adenylyltransferase